MGARLPTKKKKKWPIEYNTKKMPKRETTLKWFTSPLLRKSLQTDLNKHSSFKNQPWSTKEEQATTSEPPRNRTNTIRNSCQTRLTFKSGAKTTDSGSGQKPTTKGVGKKNKRQPKRERKRRRRRRVKQKKQWWRRRMSQ